MKRIPMAVLLIHLMAAASLFAHHGTAASYDHTKQVKLTGIVTEFVWANPHAQLHFDVKDAKGAVVNWGGECQSPGVLARQGYNKKMFKAGDEVVLTVYPSKVGAPVGEVDMTKGIVVNGKQVVPVAPPRRGGNADNTENP
jgi:uncharacterized protein DUF6152